MLLLDGDMISHPNMVRIPESLTYAYVSAHAEHYNGKVLTSILGLIHVYEIQLCSWTGLIAQLVEHLSMNAGGLRFDPWCGHFSLNN